MTPFHATPPAPKKKNSSTPTWRRTAQQRVPNWTPKSTSCAIQQTHGNKIRWRGIKQAEINGEGSKGRDGGRRSKEAGAYAVLKPRIRNPFASEQGLTGRKVSRTAWGERCGAAERRRRSGKRPTRVDRGRRGAVGREAGTAGRAERRETEERNGRMGQGGGAAGLGTFPVTWVCGSGLSSAEDRRGLLTVAAHVRGGGFFCLTCSSNN